MSGETYLTIRDNLRALVPSWMTDRVRSGATLGYRFLYAHAILGDLLLQFAIEGTRAKMPTYAPADALPAIGRDRDTPRGPEESEDAYRARLIRWLLDGKRRGSAYATLDQLAAHFTPHDVLMRIVNANGTWWTRETDGTNERVVTLPTKNWDWDGQDELWARTWVIIYPPADLWVQDGAWGDPGNWGDGGTWGSSATPEQVASVRAIVKKHRSAENVVKNVIVCFDDTAFDPSDSSPPLPDGTWGRWYKTVGGVTVPARDDRAIYWDGSL